jgi:hypothetical protein
MIDFQPSTSTSCFTSILNEKQKSNKRSMVKPSQRRQKGKAKERPKDAQPA